MNIVQAIHDERLFGTWFPGESWNNWEVFLRAVFSLPMNNGQLDRFERSTDRQTDNPQEAWVVAGRRAGKSLLSALVAVYLACFKDYEKSLVRGERATVMVIAADRRQARVVFGYISGFLNSVPMLASMIRRSTKESIELDNRVTIEVHTASFRAIRGYTVCAAICDELAFWSSEDSANPDTEILNALRPAMVTIPASLLICISSPYARRGALWEAYDRYFGVEDDQVLVWQANTRSMNPTVSAEFVAEAMARDPQAAAAEYLAEFRRDVESFVNRETVAELVDRGVQRRAAVYGCEYRAFADPSGGSQDSMTLAIAHREGDRAVLDVMLEQRPPFNPEMVAREFSALLQKYQVGFVQGDRYSGNWVREAFRRHGITYHVSDKTKSMIYGDFLPLLYAGRVRLLDQPRLL